MPDGQPSGRRLHLAQLNIGHAVAPIDSPEMADFAARLDEINALADAAPGFVWRHEGDDGYQDGGPLWGPDHLINLSVWESLEALRSFTYETAHRELLASRRTWFYPMQGPHFVAWWVPAGHRPGLEEAKARLEQLALRGSSPDAFEMKVPFGRQPTSVFADGRDG